MRWSRWALLALGALSLGSTGCHRYSKAFARAGITREQIVVDDAALTVERIRRRYRTFDSELAKAEGVLIIPRLVKGGLLIGGEGGTGVMLHRIEGGTFSSPAFFSMGSASAGIQLGYEELAVVIVFRKGQTMLRALQHGATVGGDASIAIAKEFNANDTSRAHKDVVEFIDAEGVFAGAAIEGSIVASKDSINRAYYGAGANSRAILMDHAFEQHPGALGLKRALAMAQVASAK